LCAALRGILLDHSARFERVTNGSLDRHPREDRHRGVTRAAHGRVYICHFDENPFGDIAGIFLQLDGALVVPQGVSITLHIGKRLAAQIAIGRDSGILRDQGIGDRNDFLAVAELEKDLRGAVSFAFAVGTDGGKARLGVCGLPPLMCGKERLAKR
jgi:hypothetical protein